MKNRTLYFVLCLGLLAGACSNDKHSITSGNLTIGFDQNLWTKTVSGYASEDPLNRGYSPSEILETSGGILQDFRLSAFEKSSFTDEVGPGERYTIRGLYAAGGLKIEKVVTVRTYAGFEDMALFNVSYTNLGTEAVRIKKWINNKNRVEVPRSEEALWSFQGSSTSARADWILPVPDGFYQQNYMGMNNSDYGGGIPISDVWRRDAGIAVGHAEMVPRLVSLPVEKDENDAFASLWVEQRYDQEHVLNPDDSLETYETFLMVHQGDCFSPLGQFARYMQAKGMVFPKAEEAAFEPIWCAWGYERDFTVDEITGTLPKVKELGFKWAVIDDGFQIAEGDWHVNDVKFPGGDAQMKQLVDRIHSYGLKAKLWWAPLAVDPCSNLLTENPDIIVYTEEWAPQFITWWDAYYMGPTYSKTLEHTREVLDLFIDEWGFDGLKMDGQHMNAVGPDHHPKHGLEYPEQAFEKLPEFFEMIYQTTTAKKPHAVVENCPCGTCMSFYNMPYMNQAVSSDPLSSWQIRLKGKVYKALVPETAYYGDHVELSDNGDDFASSFGVGAVLGSKFTWPKDNPTAGGTYVLTPEKEVTWKKWISLYNEKMISKGNYLGSLYDIGFDRPETHVIEKDGTMYYAFYSEAWNGKVDLRGLEKGKEYVAYDYVNDRELTQFNGDDPTIEVEFTSHLLLQVKPVD